MTTPNKPETIAPATHEFKPFERKPKWCELCGMSKSHWSHAQPIAQPSATVSAPSDETYGYALISDKARNPFPTVYAPDSELVQKMENLEDRIKQLDTAPTSKQEMIAAARADVIAKLTRAADPHVHNFVYDLDKDDHICSCGEAADNCVVKAAEPAPKLIEKASRMQKDEALIASMKASDFDEYRQVESPKAEAPQPSYAAHKFVEARKSMEKMINEDNANVRLVRPVDRSLLGQEKPEFVPLPITDDRNQNPAYAAWADVNDEIDRECFMCGFLWVTKHQGDEPCPRCRKSLPAPLVAEASQPTGEYVSVYEILGAKIDELEKQAELAREEIARLVSRTLTAEAKLSVAIESREFWKDAWCALNQDTGSKSEVPRE